MNVKQFSITTIVGAVVNFILGYLIYGMLMASFFEANMGSATGVMKTPDQLNLPLLFVGNLAFAALITYIFSHWANISTFATGMKGGMIIGGLLTLAYNLIQYSTTNIGNLTASLVDVVVAIVMIGLVGGVIGLVLGKVK